jgi:rhodanese-related sulfurtransferase
MKKTGVVFVAAVLLAASVAVAAGYRNIASTEVSSFLAKHKNAFLLDVRTPDEYRQARLTGAVLIPINEIEHRLGEVPKNRPIVVYCAVGSRSSLVAGFLAGKGYGEVYHMSDGLVGWYRNGLPLER